MNRKIAQAHLSPAVVFFAMPTEVLTRIIHKEI
jgi:hypothetical protein